MKLTVREAAKVLSVSETKIYRWVDEETIPFVMIQHHPMFHRVELLEWAVERELPLDADLYDHLHELPLTTALQRGGGTRLADALESIVTALPISDPERERIRTVISARQSEMFSCRPAHRLAIPRARSPIICPDVEAEVMLWWSERAIVLDGISINTVVLIVVPSVRDHLKLLSRLSRALHDPAFIAAACEPEAFDRVLAEARRLELAFDAAFRGPRMTLVLAAAGVLVASALAATIAARSPRAAVGLATAGAVVAAALSCWGAILALAGEPAIEVEIAWAAPIDHLRFGLDPLSAFFVVPVALLGAICAIYGAFYFDDQRSRRVLALPAALYNLLVAAMLLVLTSRDAIGFIMAWEVMTLASYLLIVFDHAQPDVRRAGWIYVIASHVGVACLLSMFLLLGDAGFGFAEIGGHNVDTASAATAAVLGLIGFGIKAGMVPLHVWLPEAHAAAPSHVSALMSGALIKLGIYGVLRTITFVPDALPWGPVLVGVGVIGAFVGISLALYQRDLKRALAYSSIENIGIVAIGLGVGLWAARAGYTRIAALGLCGGLFHVWNHAVMKGLMFLGAGSLLHGAGTRDVEQMGGLAKRMPRTATLMIVGSLAISALPPFNGFASEWLIYLGLAQGGVAPESGSGLLLLFAVAAMGTVGVLAVLCFVRIIGVTLLGQPRSGAAAAAHESSAGMIAPMVMLAGFVIAIPFLLPVLATALDPVIQQFTGSTFAGGPPSDYAIDAWSPLAVFGTVLWGGGIIAVLAIRRLTRRRRETETWGCGYVAPTSRMQYSGASFSEGIHRLLPGILRARLASQQITQLFPTDGKLSADRQDPFTRAAYAPLMDQGASRFGKLRWVQQGLLHLYILYVVIAVVVTIAVVSIRDYWVLP